MKKVYYVLLIIVVLLMNLKGFSQCGTETFSVTDWCENQYATWTITNPEAGARYHWYEPVYNAAGTTIIDTIDRFYGNNATGTNFVSPYRYTTPTPVPAGTTWDDRKFWYSKEVPKTGFAPNSTTFTAIGISESSTYTTSFTSSTDIYFNYVSVPVVLYNTGNTYTIKITIGTYQSLTYSFSGTSATPTGTSQVYLIAVPVSLRIPAGSYTMSASGTVDGWGWLAASQTFTNTNVSTTSNSKTIWGSPKYSSIYNWDYIAYCPYSYSPIANKTTTGCCNPVIGNVVLSPSKPVIISGTEQSIITLTYYSNVSHYFQWYKDGVVIPAASGVGKISYTTNQIGEYTVREVELISYANNVSCYSVGAATIQERSVFARVNNPKASYCLGDEVELEAYGSGLTNASWTPASLVEEPTNKITNAILGTTGNLNFQVESYVFAGNEIVNGDFESGSSGYIGDFTITTTEMFIYEILQRAGTDKFKAAPQLVK